MKRTLTLESNSIDDDKVLRRAMAAEVAYSGLWNIRELAIKAINGDMKADDAIDEIIDIINEDVDIDGAYS